MRFHRLFWISMMSLLASSGVPMVANAQSSQAPDDAAIQAIQQAADPSAVVAAYANGFAAGHDNSTLNSAYVARMVDLGMPEMAYHQAQALTATDTKDGLAWGVVAYVDARRGEMPEAVSAINLAGQLAPNHQFVERNAGEIAAWYDVKADKSQLPDNAKDGLEKVRTSLGTHAAFTQAYDTAKQAYQSQASATQQQPAPQQPVQAAPLTPDSYAPSVPPEGAPVQYATPAVPTYYGNYDYYYDSGPGWAEPSPWAWWEPVGFWGGFDFFPGFSVLVFNDRHSFRHHDFDRHTFNDRFDRHDGLAFRRGDPSVWHGRTQSRASFFGTPARPAWSSATDFHRSIAAAPITRSFGTERFSNIQRQRIQSSIIGGNRSFPSVVHSAPFIAHPSFAAPSHLSSFSREPMAISPRAFPESHFGGGFRVITPSPSSHFSSPSARFSSPTFSRDGFGGSRITEGAGAERGGHGRR